MSSKMCVLNPWCIFRISITSLDTVRPPLWGSNSGNPLLTPRVSVCSGFDCTCTLKILRNSPRVEGALQVVNLILLDQSRLAKDLTKSKGKILSPWPLMTALHIKWFSLPPSQSTFANWRKSKKVCLLSCNLHLIEEKGCYLFLAVNG